MFLAKEHHPYTVPAKRDNCRVWVNTKGSIIQGLAKMRYVLLNRGWRELMVLVDGSRIKALKALCAVRLSPG